MPDRPTTITEPAREIPVLATPDVLVVGGGPAGIAAALAAARTGADVMLAERYGFLGGAATNALVPHFDPVQLLDVSGIPREVYENLKEAGYLVERPVTAYQMPYTFWESGSVFDPEELKFMAIEMLETAGVKLLLHTMAVSAIVRGSAVKAVVVEGKSGRQAIQAQVTVDATGDGDVAAAAGAPFETGSMALTLCFRMGNVMLRETLDYFERHPDEFGTHPTLGRYIRDPATSCILAGFHGLVTKAVRNGDLPQDLLRETGISMHLMPRTDEVVWNAMAITKVDALDARDLTSAEVQSRKMVRSLVSFARKYLPGFASSHLIDTAVQIGVRETRRIRGDHVLTLDDIESGRRFDDAVVRAKWGHTDVHDPDTGKWTYSLIEGPYEIPYRSLLPKGIDNLLVSGRCISVSHEALATVRIIPLCMATGQAAGVAAGIVVRNGLSPRRIDIAELREILSAQGVRLD